MAAEWTRLVRFEAEEDGLVHLGEMTWGESTDIGLALHDGKKVTAKLVEGSVFDGVVTEKTMTVAKVRC
jgi:predicted RNA-binding protein with RPS1 domain